MVKQFAVAVVALGLASAPLFGSNSLSVTSGAALEGSKGLQVACDGSTNNVYVESQEPNGETHYLAKFLIRPSTLNITIPKAVRIANIFTPQGQSVLLFLKRTDSAWQLKLKYQDETNPGFARLSNQSLVLAGSENVIKQVEIEWQSDTSNGATNGFIRMRRCNADGVSGCSGWRSSDAIGNIDNDQMTIEAFRLGIVAGTGNQCGGAGNYHFDGFQSFR